MFSRRNKPKTIEELPSRYLGLSGPLPVIEEEPTAPRKIAGVPVPAFLLVGALLGCLVIAVVFVYKATLPQLLPPQARDLNAEAVEVILDAARVYHQQNNLGKAEIVLSAGVREHPQDQQKRIAYAEMLMMSNQLDSAFYEYTEALRIGPRDADLEFVAGIIADKLDEVALAEAHFTAARNADPTQPSYGMFLAQVQLKQHKYDDAIVSLIQVRPLDPDNAMIYGTLAEIYTKKNDVGIALDQIEIARQLEPQRAAWKIIEARLLKRSGEPERALLLFDSLADNQRNATPIMRNRAECYGMISRPDLAAGMYQAASDAQPDDPDLAYEAAVWSDKAGQIARAISYGERARKLGHEQADKLVKRLSQ